MSYPDNFSAAGDAPDLRRVADLISAGAELGVKPGRHEDPLAFALRVAEAGEARRRRPVVFAARVAVGLALAAFGISSF